MEDGHESVNLVPVVEESLILQLLREVREKMNEVEIRFDSFEIRTRVIEHNSDMAAKKANELESHLLMAFPNSDVDGHRVAHELAIERSRLINEILRTGLIKSCSAGIVVGIGWLIYAVGAAIKLEIMK